MENQYEYHFRYKDSISQEENNNYTSQNKSIEGSSERPKMYVLIKHLPHLKFMNLIKPSFRRSLSLIEPVKEEDENVLMDEIDQLAKQRNSSLAPIQFRNTIKALRPTYVEIRFSKNLII